MLKTVLAESESMMRKVVPNIMAAVYDKERLPANLGSLPWLTKDKHTHAHAHAHAPTRTRAHAHTRTRTHAHTHAHTHTHTHTKELE